MQHSTDLKICYDRIIPEDLAGNHPELQRMREEAVMRATGASSPREAFHTLDPIAVIPPPHLALISSKAWPAGSRLRCRFLEGSPTQRQRVQHKAKIWETFANIHLDFVTSHDEHV